MKIFKNHAEMRDFKTQICTVNTKKGFCGTKTQQPIFDLMKER